MTDSDELFDRFQQQIWPEVVELSKPEQIGFFRALASWAQTETELLEFNENPFSD